jgi:hypothetical protein
MDDLQTNAPDRVMADFVRESLENATEHHREIFLKRDALPRCWNQGSAAREGVSIQH